MKRPIVVTASAALFAFGLAIQNVSPAVAQQFAEGPVGEINSPLLGDSFGGNSFAGSEVGGAGFASSPNVVYTPQGEAIEVFNPSVPFEQNSEVVPNLLATPVVEPNTKTDWITPEGRINFDNGSPESQLWAPNSPGTGGWADGPLGLQVGIDGLFFSRGINTGAPFAFTDSGETFSNADFDLDVESTARYRLGVASEFGTGYEFVYYDFDSFTGSLSLTGEGITPFFFGIIPADPVESYTANYDSRIKNFELNVWARRSQRVRVGYGLRYFSIEEDYDVIFNDDGNSGGTTTTTTATTGGEDGFFSSTDNDLFGGQIMVELFQPMTTTVSLNGGAKGMLLNNDAEVDVDTANLDSNGDDSFVTGGVNFWGGVTYRPMRGLSLQAGYEGVFIGSVATATSQSDNSNQIGYSESVTPFGEGLYFGGGYAGCTLTF